MTNGRISPANAPELQRQMGAKTGYSHAIDEYHAAMSMSGPAIPGVIGVPLIFRTGTGMLVIIPM